MKEKEVYLEPKEKINVYSKYFDTPKMRGTPRYITIASNKDGTHLYIIHLGKRYSLDRFYKELETKTANKE